MSNCSIYKGEVLSPRKSCNIMPPEASILHFQTVFGHAAAWYHALCDGTGYCKPPMHLYSVVLTACMRGENSREFLTRTVSQHCTHIFSSRYCTREQYLPSCTLSSGVLLQPARAAWVELGAYKHNTLHEDRRRKRINSFIPKY